MFDNKHVLYKKNNLLKGFFCLIKYKFMNISKTSYVYLF